jgi:hypothetical protein
MADLKISQLTSATTPLAGTETLPIVQSGSTKKVSVNDLTAGKAVSASTVTVATTVGVGAATPAATGAGITFPATQSASSDVNTLDDYEEGTWTPSLNFSGGTTGLVGTQTGIYIKIGSMVYVQCAISLSNKGSSVGNAVITGLPFAVGTSFAATMSAYDIANSGYIWAQGSSSQFVLYTVSLVGTRSNLTNTQFANSSDFIVTGTYQV